MKLSRRHAIITGTTLLAAAAIGPAPAAQPPVGRQVASLYRSRVGDIEVTAISDGSIALPPAVFGEANLTEARRILAENFLPTEGPVPCALNTFLVNAGGKLSLIDTGSGDALGPTMGQLPANLAAMGVTPAMIDSLVLTHMHRDHAGGLCSREGAALFPTAELVIPEVEAAFWFDEGNINRVPQGSRGGFAYAKQVEAAYRGRIRRVPGGRGCIWTSRGSGICGGTRRGIIWWRRLGGRACSAQRRPGSARAAGRLAPRIQLGRMSFSRTTWLHFSQSAA